MSQSWSRKKTPKASQEQFRGSWGVGESSQVAGEKRTPKLWRTRERRREDWQINMSEVQGRRAVLEDKGRCCLPVHLLSSLRPVRGKPRSALSNCTQPLPSSRKGRGDAIQRSWKRTPRYRNAIGYFSQRNMRCANWAQWGIKEKNRIHIVGRETRECWGGGGWKEGVWDGYEPSTWYTCIDFQRINRKYTFKWTLELPNGKDEKKVLKSESNPFGIRDTAPTQLIYSRDLIHPCMCALPTLWSCSLPLPLTAVPVSSS